MKLHPAFKHTIATTPEWQAWLRQCEIDEDFDVHQNLLAGELTAKQLGDFIQYASYQRAICTMIQVGNVVDMSLREKNSVINYVYV